MQANFDSFGRIDRHERQAVALSEVRAQFGASDGPVPSLLAFGNGRSYGNSCHNDAGLLVLMRAHHGIISFDPATGILEVQSGTIFIDIIQYIASEGYFFPVTPGTCFVTVGGAIANDVHGKNHHLRGSFGRYVESLELLRSDGVQYHCSPSENAALFSATIGGMGLTGIILSARIRLMPVGSLDVVEKIAPFSKLTEYFEMADAADQNNEYSVAWVDQLAKGRSEGRGVLITGNHADNDNRDPNNIGSKIGVPFELPFSALNHMTLSVFNAAYFWAKSRKQEPHLTHFGSFFYPLDSVNNWNRLYGPKGLYQHQSVIPYDAAQQVIPLMLNASRQAGQASFLTVLKRFGDLKSPGLMSFPKPGYTLTMDFPNRGEQTCRLLDRLDAMTIDAGGRINPYKDQHMSARTFKTSFPEWTALEQWRDERFCSDFWRKTALATDTTNF